MKHYGDITKLNGYELPIVDCITGGSPCQDLSVAGKRAGLDGERSGLFMEQIRIVKEMREHDRNSRRSVGSDIRPRYLVWENVAGAMSSPGGKNKGRDFQAVLTEIVKIANPESPDVPLPKGGLWSKSGAIMGRGKDGTLFSIAWRLHNAQFWNVPQRRVRLCVVGDFGGLSAPEICFERKGLSGNVGQSSETRKGPAGETEESVRETSEHLNESYTLKIRCGAEIDSSGKRAGKGALVQKERAGTLGVSQDQTLINIRSAEAYGISPFESNAMKSPNPHSGIYKADSSRTLDENGGNPSCNQGGIVIVQSVYDPSVWHGYREFGNVSETVKARYGTGGNNLPIVASEMSTARKFTPKECERLQGFPDDRTNIGDWVDSKGKTHKDSDSPRYKALGNSIALPFWFWLLRRISAQYERPATLGSLFDGIGGFPLCWERCNGKGTAIWASEIEEFCIAVTKKHFPEEE